MQTVQVPTRTTSDPAVQDDGGHSERKGCRVGEKERERNEARSKCTDYWPLLLRAR